MQHLWAHSLPCAAASWQHVNFLPAVSAVSRIVEKAKHVITAARIVFIVPSSKVLLCSRIQGASALAADCICAQAAPVVEAAIARARLAGAPEIPEQGPRLLAPNTGPLFEHHAIVNIGGAKPSELVCQP